MVLDSLEVAHLLMTKSKTLLKDLLGHIFIRQLRRNR